MWRISLWNMQITLAEVGIMAMPGAYGVTYISGIARVRIMRRGSTLK